MISKDAKRRVKKILLWIEILFILVMGAGVGVVLGAFYQMNKMLPPDSVLDHWHPPVGTKIYSSDKVLLANLATENRDPVPLSQIPKNMQNAIVAIEDSRFYQHNGLDWRGLGRAVWANVTGHELAQGGSTITQQLARNMFLSSRKKISRKIKEMLLAVQIERNWTKKEILQAYLNQVYFGAGAYGVQAASKVYFGKDCRKLTLPEAALLAGMPQRPSDINPFSSYAETGKYDRTKARRDMVLNRMYELKYITKEQREKAVAAPIKVVKSRPETVGLIRAKYFGQFVLDQLRQTYDEDLLNKAGLTVITTLNWKMQQQAERAAREGLDRWRRRGRVSETALVCLDPHTGYIRAMVGGVQQPWEKYQFNCATQAHRQPGSSFKLFVYGAAFQAGRNPYWTVNSNVQPIRMTDGTWYEPKNHERVGGRMTYERAFALSVNGAAVNVCVDIGPKNVADLAHRMGITSELHPYPSLALGTSEVTPLEMATAYGCVPANGKHFAPIGILQIRSQDGEVIEDFQPSATDTGLKPETIESLNTLTQSVVQYGTGTAARIVPGAHGKTGTTEDYTDAWFVGFTPDLVTAVWAGNRDNAKMSRLYGGTICAPIWADYMKEAVKLNPAKKQHPAAVVKLPLRKRSRNFRPVATPLSADETDRNRITVNVCTESGLLATDYCPHTERQEFLIGEQPLRRCNIHTAKTAKTDKSTRERDDADDPAQADPGTPDNDADKNKAGAGTDSGQ